MNDQETFDLTPAFLSIYRHDPEGNLITPLPFFADKNGTLWLPTHCIALIMRRYEKNHSGRIHDKSADKLAPFNNNFWYSWNAKYFMNEYALFMIINQKLKDPDDLMDFLLQEITRCHCSLSLFGKLPVYEINTFAEAAGFPVETLFK